MGMVLEKELTGYDIKKEVTNSIGNFYKASYGRLYPALNSLTDKGYLSMNEKMQGKRQKKYYKTTALGQEAFLEWLAAPLDPNMGGEAQLARIFFYGELPQETRDKRLQEYEFYAGQYLQQLQNIEKSVTVENLSDKDYFGISTLYYGLQLAHSQLRWFKCIREKKPFTEFLQKHDG